MSRANEKLKLLHAGETMLLKQRGHLERGAHSGHRLPSAAPFCRSRKGSTLKTRAPFLFIAKFMNGFYSQETRQSPSLLSATR